MGMRTVTKKREILSYLAELPTMLVRLLKNLRGKLKGSSHLNNRMLPLRRKNLRSSLKKMEKRGKILVVIR